MNVIVLYFAQARDRAGRASETLALPEGSVVADAIAAVRQMRPALEPMWAHLAIAVDGRLTDARAPLRDGAELALLPPVSGG